MKIQIVNGPNLNLLGKRETNIYGSQTFEDYFETLQQQYPNVSLSYFQSNVEGELINKLQEVGFTCDGIILNAGAYTHTSVALHDCIRSISSSVVEVHISNTQSREEFRHTSLISSVCKGVIAGFGLRSYELALLSFLSSNTPIQRLTLFKQHE
jgi:3-dehydroquinate dehydratase, type II